MRIFNIKNVKKLKLIEGIDWSVTTFVFLHLFGLYYFSTSLLFFEQTNEWREFDVVLYYGEVDDRTDRRIFFFDELYPWLRHVDILDVERKRALLINKWTISSWVIVGGIYMDYDKNFHFLITKITCKKKFPWFTETMLPFVVRFCFY